MPRIDNRIRTPEVRLIGPAGEQLGVVATSEALFRARAAGLNLVEISPTARPPVCRITDYGKFRYEQSKKEHANRKNAAAAKVKEVQFRPSVESADYQVKLRRMKEFLLDGSRVKVAISFKGRENAHKELGYELIERILSDIRGIGICEQAAKQMGRIIVLTVMPNAKGIAAARAAAAKEAAAAADGPAKEG
ncbi:MAG: translation initiation factor IF-3 [Kiritimatiellae bacterium]|nr:translation initiation factor IF-3 [Kiritimatiellia bacterium]